MRHTGKCLRLEVAGGLLLAAMLAGGCAVPPKVEPISVAVPQSLDATSSRDAGIVGSALQFAMLAPSSFSAEPKGDVTTDGVVRVYAHISRVSTTPPSITFDVAQVYSGPYAVAEAKRDHQELTDAEFYERNAYKHTQKASVVESTGVVLQSPREDVDRAYGAEDFAQITATSFEEFAKRFASADEGERFRRTGYWIVLDADGVRSITQQYEP